MSNSVDLEELKKKEFVVLSKMLRELREFHPAVPPYYADPIKNICAYWAAAIEAVLEFRKILIEEVERYQWQPIETAPKDGTIILGARQLTEGRWIQDTIYWNPEFEMTGSDEETLEFFYRGAWTDGSTDGFEDPTELRPSFWMPLPPPPALQSGGSKRTQVFCQPRTSHDITVVVPCQHVLPDGSLCEDDLSVTVEHFLPEPASRDFPGTGEAWAVVGGGDCPKHYLRPDEVDAIVRRALGTAREVSHG